MRRRVVFFIAEGPEIWSIAGFRSLGEHAGEGGSLFLALVEPKFAKLRRTKLASPGNTVTNSAGVKQNCLFFFRFG